MTVAYTVAAVLGVLLGIILYSKLQMISLLLMTLASIYLITGSVLIGVGVFGLYYVILQTASALINLNGSIKARSMQAGPVNVKENNHSTGQYL